MRFNCLTLFPAMFQSFTGESILQRAIKASLVEICLYDIREYSKDKHRKADDYPFGGGAGLVMMPQPLYDCFYDVQAKNGGLKARNVYMSPKGRPLTNALAQELADYDALNLLCGHYEGIDQRVVDKFIDEEVSIGDYILTGGELPAMVLIDSVMRFVPGVLGNEESGLDESFAQGLLEYPQYTRPADYEGEKVPEVLLSGHHENIMLWRRQKALEETFYKRPDLLKNVVLSKKDAETINAVKCRNNQD
jgi:tRNA (guanine37-N1)-methyltransferase